MSLIQLLSVYQSKQCIIDFRQLLGLSGYFSRINTVLRIFAGFYRSLSTSLFKVIKKLRSSLYWYDTWSFWLSELCPLEPNDSLNLTLWYVIVQRSNKNLIWTRNVWKKIEISPTYSLN